MTAVESAPAACGAVGSPPSADPWRRLMGAVYECIILFGVIWFADYLFTALTRYQGEPGPMRTAFQLFTALVLAVYFAGFWARGRRTVPMKTLGMQLLDSADRPLTTARALARFAAALGAIIGALALGHEVHGALYLLLLLPYGWCLFDRQRRALYDVLAGTRLVYQPIADAPRRRRTAPG